MNKKENLFIEIAHSTEYKHGQIVGGDTFLSRKISGDNRYVAVLSDGLGSGVKANVLSTMTASMALNFRLRREPILRSAINIMNALPIDSIRNISYATFTIVDTDFEGKTQVIEFDSPEFLLFREGVCVDPQKEMIGIDKEGHSYKAYSGNLADKKQATPDNFRVLYKSNIKLCRGDRIIFFSDGVTQAGMGMKESPFGWGDKGIKKFVSGILQSMPNISARDLSRLIVNTALKKDSMKSKDDISCAVFYARQPRTLLISSGPPYDSKNDLLLARSIEEFSGKTVICGGTTSKIIARELNLEIGIDLAQAFGSKYPPLATIDGIDLVTEGILTLGMLAEMLKQDNPLECNVNSPAWKIVSLIMESDMIVFYVGTRINEAHQDPSLPVELEIRRNVIKRIVNSLEEKWLKKVEVRYI